MDDGGNQEEKVEKKEKSGKGFISRLREKKGLLIGAGLLIAFFAGFVIVQVIQSGKPQPITVDYTVDYPSPTDYEKAKIYPLVINFKGSAAKLEDTGTAPAAAPQIKPEIQGGWFWSDESTLVFTPDEPWTIGENYEVRLPDELFPGHIRVSDSRFDFNIEPFQASITKGEFYIDPQDSGIKRVLAEIHCNYPVVRDGIEKYIFIKPRLKADSGSVVNRNYSFTASFSDDGKTIYIVSEPVGMPADDIQMDVILESGLESEYGGKPVKDRASIAITVPGVSSYVRVNSVDHRMIENDRMQYEQVVIIDTKGRATPDEISSNLELWLLPVDKPELPGLRGAKDYRWRNIEDVVDGVLELSERIDTEAIPLDTEYSSIFSFRIDAPPKRYAYLKIKAGTKFYGGYYLNKDYETVFALKDYPREISILSEGSLLSLSGGRRLSMLSRGISSVSYKISRIRPDDLNHLVSQSNGNMNNLNFQNYRFNEYNISEVYRRSARVSNSTDPREMTYFSFNFNDYLAAEPDRNLKNGLFLFTVSGERPYSGYSERRLVLVTDLGFFVKTGDTGEKDVFVQSISDGRPVSGAVVELWGKNGNVIKASTTGSSGYVGFDGLQEFRDEHAPTVWVVKRGADLSFMPYYALGRSLDYSNFDVGGVYGAQDPKTLSAFMFSDRGIYRPGDKINIAMIVKAGDWGIDLGGTPLECIITDPTGLQVYSEPVKLSTAGFEEIGFKTQDYSPTGVYNVSLFVIRKNDRREFLGSDQFKIEEFLPDTLTVNVGFTGGTTDGWISPDDVTAEVSARNLFGTPAEGNRVGLNMTLTPGYQHFRNFADYDFFDPLVNDERYEEDLGTLITDSNGSVRQKINLGKFDTGTYNLRLDAEVFEKDSGRSVKAQASVTVSPLSFLVGRKSDGELDYISRNAERNISFIAVSSRLKAIKAGDLRLRISEISYVSSLVRQPNGVYKYKSIKKEDVRSEVPFEISADGTTFSLPTGDSGDFVLSVTDSEGTELSRTDFSVVGRENVKRSLDRTAELELKLDKADYKPGEAAEIFIKAPYSGGGLITVERDRVYNYKWFTLDGSATTQRIEIPASLEGNGYITVSLARSRASNEIYMSPLSYGVVPFSVSRESRTNAIELEIPEEARPGEPFPITFSTEKPGKIAVFAVDEGILQVARYKTPDPLAFFFRKRALEVTTAQILDLVLPEFDVVQSVAAMGGGAGAEELARNLNPFKRKRVEPVAYWSGIIDSGPGKQTLEYRIPGYFNGSLRVMAVSVAPDALGSVQKTSLIRSPWVIVPNVPQTAAPGDEFDISVTVTNMNKGSGPDSLAVLNVDPGDRLEVIGERSVAMTMAEGRDGVAGFRVRALSSPGAAEIGFSVSGLGEKSFLSSYLSVRPPVPYRTELTSGVVENGTAEAGIGRRLYDEFAGRSISASYIPISLADGLNFYLQKFPYGCTEQITSASFPKLYPNMIEELGMDTAEIKEDIERTINILQARQNSDGGFGLWTSKSETHPVIDSYVMHFLTLARENRYFVPESMYNRGIEQLKNIAGSGLIGKNDLTYRCYAVYVLTLNQIVTTSFIERLTVDLKKNFEDWESGFCGMFISGSYALMKQQREAEALIRKARRSIARDTYLDYYNHLCYPAVYLYMLGEYFPGMIRSVSDELLQQIADDIKIGAYSTFSANYAMLGISAYLKAVPSAVKRSFSVSELDADGNETRLETKGDPLMRADYSPGAEVIRIRNRDSVPLFYQVTSAGFDLEIPGQVSNGIEVYRDYLNSDGEVLNEFRIGENVTVRIRCRSLGKEPLRNIAIVDMLPAGLEPDIRSIRDAATGAGSLNPDYTDIREDRLVLFATITDEIGEFTYTARAINTGSFVTPPAFAESMYDLGIWSYNPCDNLIISK